MMYQLQDNHNLKDGKYLLSLRCYNVIGSDSTVIHLAYILESFFDTVTLFVALTTDLSIMLNNSTYAY